jgi:hypothetical protein
MTVLLSGVPGDVGPMHISSCRGKTTPFAQLIMQILPSDSALILLSKIFQPPI